MVNFKKMFFALATSLLLVALPILELYAQPGGGPPPDPGRPVPIQGIGILVAAGAYLGIKKIIQDRKTSKKN